MIKTENKNHFSTLTRNGKTIDLNIDGTVLESQFELEDGFILIWLTEDSPYEEGLHVYLLDKNDNIVDAIEAGANFTPGILKILKSGKNWLEFAFFLNDSVFRLEVTPKAGFRVLLPVGWKYKKLFSLHRLMVQEM